MHQFKPQGLNVYDGAWLEIQSHLELLSDALDKTQSLLLPLRGTSDYPWALQEKLDNVTQKSIRVLERKKKKKTEK